MTILKSSMAAALLLAVSTSCGFAAQLSYNATSNMGTPVTISGVTFDLAMLGDSITAANVLNGYVVDDAAGAITFKFGGLRDIAKAEIWNNVVVDHTGGLRKAKMKFFRGGTLVHTEPFIAANSADPGPLSMTQSIRGVDRAVLTISDSFDRVELREVRFEGHVPKPFDKESCEDGHKLNVVNDQHTKTKQRNGAFVFGPGGSYAIAGFRKYGEAVNDKIFYDFFPLVRKNEIVCEVIVTAKGTTPEGADNDSINVYLPNHGGQITPGGNWKDIDQVVRDPGNVGPFPAGQPWTRTWTINYATPGIQAALTGGINAIDVYAQDDTTVESVTLQYKVR